MVDGGKWRGRWKNGIGLAKDIGEYTKLVALVLTVIGFIAAYFPSAKRDFELIANPSAWYFVGGVYGEKFGHYDYQNPIWDNGVIRIPALSELPGKIIVTTKSNEPHNGRDAPGGGGNLTRVVPENACLYVREFRILPIAQPRQGGPQSAVWARAQQVTC